MTKKINKIKSNVITFDKDIILAEYKSIRDEIIQLNTQIFTVFTGTLALVITILGWMFTKENLQNYINPLIIIIFVLLCGNIIVINRNRLAHRLAYYQKYFIESKLTDISWSRVYLLYREKNKSKFKFLIERLSESISYLFVFISFIIFVIIVCLSFPTFCINQIFMLILGFFVTLISFLLTKFSGNFKEIEQTLIKIKL